MYDAMYAKDNGIVFDIEIGAAIQVIKNENYMQN